MNLRALRFIRFIRITALLLGLWSGLVHAHKPSDAYLWLDVDQTGIDGRWDIALRDLDVALGLDANQDNKLTWGEVRSRAQDIDTYALSRLTIAAGQATGASACVLQPQTQPQTHAIDQHSDGTYLVIRFRANCNARQGFRIDYQLFEDIDPTHRGVTRVSFSGQPPRPLVLDPAHGVTTVLPEGAAAQTTPPEAAGSTASSTVPTLAHAGFLREGIHHILTGYDHILFLLCLLLPSVLSHRGSARDGTWQPVSLGAALWPLARTITAFTIAHSITLGLASARIVHLSPRFIEPAIAVTIMLAALNNLWPVVTRRIALITFAFGLIHGFGFAEVLRDLDLSTSDFAWALLQFNVGVEIGQLLVVAVAIAPLYLLRQTRHYQTAVLGGGSLFGMTIAGVWFAERVFDFKVLPL